MNSIEQITVTNDNFVKF